MKKKLHVIVNQGARTGKASRIWKKLQHILDEKSIDYEVYFTEYEHHATELTEKLFTDDIEDKTIPIYLIVVGGDGTINEVLNGIPDFNRARLGVIPTGSGNDFGRNLWIPKNPKKGLEMILSCIEREEEGIAVPRLDLGQVVWDGCKKPRIFGISAGIGLDAIVCKKALHSRMKKFLNFFHMGKLTYLFFTIQSLFTMKTAEAEWSSGNGKKGKLHNMIYAAAMNLRAEGGGVPMAPHASPTDGYLSLSSASGIPKWKTFFCLPFLLAAKHERIKGFAVKDASCIRLKTDQPVVLHADGEYCAEITEAEFVCLAGKLQLLR